MCRDKEFSFRWKEDGDPEGFTVWSIFKPDTKYFERAKELLSLTKQVYYGLCKYAIMSPSEGGIRK
jgi:hypothetical protein